MNLLCFFSGVVILTNGLLDIKLYEINVTFVISFRRCKCLNAKKIVPTIEIKDVIKYDMFFVKNIIE